MKKVKKLLIIHGLFLTLSGLAFSINAQPCFTPVNQTTDTILNKSFKDEATNATIEHQKIQINYIDYLNYNNGYKNHICPTCVPPFH